MQQIYRRTPISKWDLNTVALQRYWNHTSAWVFSCKFASYFQNSFFLEHLWTAASWPKLISNFNELRVQHKNKNTYFCTVNKPATDNYGSITIKTPSKNSSNISNFSSNAKLLQLLRLHKFTANIEDNHFNIECRTIENISFN